MTDTDLTPAAEQRDFWTAVAESYDGVVDAQIGPGARARVRERLASEGRLGIVAEFGCGTGYYTEVLASHSDRVVATDLAPGMLELARRRVSASNVSFQTEDCQRTSFPDAAFDGAFVSLVLHFTEPEVALRELHRILRPDGLLLVSNLDLPALRGFARVRCLARILFRGIVGYRRRPPPRLGANVLSAERLCDLLVKTGFEVLGCDVLRDLARSSSIPLDWVRARRLLLRGGAR